jgi:MaoC like domain
VKESPPAPRGRSRLAPTRSAVAALQLREREPLDQLHHDRPGGVVLQAVDRGDVRVVEGGEGLRLAREPREALAIVEEAARQSMFQGLAASGWHTAGMTMRLLVDSDLRPAGGIVGLGFEEFRWPWPVRPGDELRVESEILDGRPSKTVLIRGS